MTGAWSRYEESGDEPRSTLSDVEREVFAVCDLRQEVNSGGFDNYFRSWGGDTAIDALGALPAVLGQAWADLLGEAVALLGPEYPSDADERAELLDDAAVDDRLEELDDRFYALEGSVDADARLDAYLADNSV